MNYTGQIIKMHTKHSSPIEYELMFGEESVCMNDFIKKYIILKYENEINCIDCGRKTNKSFAQGFCYPCFLNSPLTSECILRPELCCAHKGESRDMEWSQKYCLTEQHVYMSFTGNLNIGVTRFSQVPTRWIDQGATKAIILCTTPNRYLAGLIEVYLKEYYSDRTNWRKMLSGDFDEPNFDQEYSKVTEILELKYSQYLNKNDWVNIKFPILSIPAKIKSFSFDKNDSYEDTLVGIKGQYLLFKNNIVLNIRKHTGYQIKIEY